MIELVFSDSALGSLKMAQHYGDGIFNRGAVGLIVNPTDGRNPTKAEIQSAWQQAQERERLAWETAMPMGGECKDAYGLHLCLSIGDIAEDIPGEKRRQLLEWLYGVYPAGEGEPEIPSELIQNAATSMNEVRSRISSGEDIRVWYSNQPDELCGLYWLMAQLCQPELPRGKVFLVKLPDWEPCADGNTALPSGWGSVEPGQWHRYLALQKTATPAFCRSCAAHWERLRKENAPLRAMLNGRLVSAPATLYDDFIAREIAAEAEEFHEARLIGRILGKYELGIGDAWIALRIEEMIRAGRLVPITNPAPDSPVYHRMLRKV